MTAEEAGVAVGSLALGLLALTLLDEADRRRRKIKSV